MALHRIALAAVGLLALGGCVAYPVDGVYADASPAYIAPPSVYVATPPIYLGGGYRPYYGGHRHGGWRHGGRGHRGWR